MRLRGKCICLATACLLGAVTACFGANPVVEYLRISPRSDSQLIDIEYRVADPDGDPIPVYVSAYDYADGRVVAINSLTGEGANGEKVASGIHRLVWDPSADGVDVITDDLRIALRVSDQAPLPPEGFVAIPGGTFAMGDALGDGPGIGDETPLHIVTISPFYMAQAEITKSQWDDVLTWALANGYEFDNSGSAKAAGHPVNMVNWYDVVKWCNARSEKEGLRPCYTVDGAVYRSGRSELVVCDWSADGYRLPTEAEWEYAARGGLSGRRFPLGNTLSHAVANYFGSGWHAYDASPTRYYHPAYRDRIRPYTSPAGAFVANGYGLYDVAGNVWEWCWDWYDADYYQQAPAVNPRGPGASESRIIRGGSWFYYANLCRVSHRPCSRPGTSYSYYGFRPVRAAVQNCLSATVTAK
jgi:formylglycine-generating enzyme required for sulfatase activity